MDEIIAAAQAKALKMLKRKKYVAGIRLMPRPKSVMIRRP
jgi:hypothetical protein